MHAINPSYAALMLLAILTCSLLLRRSQRQLPLSGQQKLVLGIAAFCGAMLGAKAPFVISDPAGLLSGMAWFADGKTIVFGIVGGYFGVEVGKWVLEVRVKTGDTFAIPVAVAVVIGRLGCFQAGCCYGAPTELPWGIAFPTAPEIPPIPRHPTQLYEAAFHLLAVLTLLRLRREPFLQGQLIKLYILAYLGYRFVTEFIRPEPVLWGGLTGYQWATLALAPIFVGLWIRDARSRAGESWTDAPPVSEPETARQVQTELP